MKKAVAMLAPSFVSEFSYPEIISKLHSLGFSRVVELTFGAKMINREYHKILSSNNNLIISSTCPGIVSMVNQKYPEHVKNLARIDSPMIATAKICKKIYPNLKTCFISPCNFKKQEASNSSYVDYCIDYQELREMLKKLKKKIKKNLQFDRFYNEYTRIYPVSGGLSKTAHLKGVLKKGEEKTIDGIQDVERFLKRPSKIKFLDCTFCKGGCIGGPFISSRNISKNKRKVLDYLELAKRENIPKFKAGLIEKAKGLKFSY